MPPGYDPGRPRRSPAAGDEPAPVDAMIDAPSGGPSDTPSGGPSDAGPASPPPGGDAADVPHAPVPPVSTPAPAPDIDRAAVVPLAVVGFLALVAVVLLVLGLRRRRSR